MAHGSTSDSPFPDDGFGRLIWIIDRILKPIELLFTFAGGLLVFLLMFLGMLQIILRNVFGAPIFGYIDIVEFGMVGFALLAISYVQREGIHVRMEIVVGAFKGRALWLMETINTTLAIIIIAILIPYTYQHFNRAYEFGDSTLDIELPTWPGKLVVPIALTLLLIRLAVQWLGYLRLLANPTLMPVAVPLIKSVEEAAEEEIEVTN